MAYEGGTMGSMPLLGLRAVFDDSDAQRRMTQFNNRLHATESALDKFERRSVQTSKKTADAQETSAKKQMKGLRSLRWELVTIMFFMRIMSRAVTAAWERMGEAAEDRAMIEGVKALAAAYRQNLREIVEELHAVADGTQTTADLVGATQQALLEDQGRFAEEYASLWEQARLAAAVTGVETEKIFVSMVEALAQGEGQILDSTAALYQMEVALMAYAVATGRTVDELEEQEKVQVMLNRIQDVTNALIASGAEEALNESATLERLATAWHNLTGALAAVMETTGFIETFTDVVIAAAQAVAVLGAGLATHLVLMHKWRTEGFMMFADLEGLAETVRDTFLFNFQRIAEGMGGMFEDIERETMAMEGADLMPDFEPAIEDRIRDYHEFLEKINALTMRYQSRLEDLYISHARRLEDIEYEKQRRIAELAITAQRRLEDIALRYQRAVEDAYIDFYRDLQDMDWDNTRDRLRIWQRYWDAVYDINRRYSDAMYEAMAERDATAALMAMRQRERDLEDAARDRDQALADQVADYDRQVAEARRRLQEQLEDAETARQRGMEDLARYLADQMDEIERSYIRQQEDLERHLEWRLKRLGDQFKLEYLEAFVAYTGQEELLQTHVDNMKAIWDSFYLGMGLPAIPPPPLTTGPQQWAKGGMGIFSQPTTIMVGEGGKPELVMAVPLGGTSAPALPAGDTIQHQVSGTVQQQVTGIIESSMAGFEGRLAAAFASMLGRVLR